MVNNCLIIIINTYIYYCNNRKITYIYTRRDVGSWLGYYILYRGYYSIHIISDLNDWIGIYV